MHEDSKRLKQSKRFRNLAIVGAVMQTIAFVMATVGKDVATRVGAWSVFLMGMMFVILGCLASMRLTCEWWWEMGVWSDSLLLGNGDETDGRQEEEGGDQARDG